MTVDTKIEKYLMPSLKAAYYPMQTSFTGLTVAAKWPRQRSTMLIIGRIILNRELIFYLKKIGCKRKQLINRIKWLTELSLVWCMEPLKSMVTKRIDKSSIMSTFRKVSCLVFITASTIITICIAQNNVISVLFPVLTRLGNLYSCNTVPITIIKCTKTSSKLCWSCVN